MSNNSATIRVSRPRLARAIRGACMISLLSACSGRQPPLPDLPRATDTPALLARGEYIVRNVAVCGHCHAASPQEDPDGPLSGGMEFRNWRTGTIRASNLTPDSATGIGAWTDAELVRAIRTGQHRSDRVLAPVMPYPWFHGMSDEDALAVVRYLKSLEPVRHRVENDPNLVFEIGQLFFLRPEDAPAGTAPPRGPTPAYGRYLANHVALCGDCHTPRTGLLSTPDLDRRFAGQPDPPGGFPAKPDNLTPDPATGIGNWTEEDFVRTLRTGINPRGDTLHAFMPWRQFSRMTRDDLVAIYRYLRTLEPIRSRTDG